jgi:hypothetical protein
MTALEQWTKEKELNDQRKEAKPAVDALLKHVNNTAFNPAGFVSLLMSRHRTLQQSTMRLFMACIKEWSEEKNFDLRNEATVVLAKKIMDAVGNCDGLPSV